MMALRATESRWEPLSVLPALVRAYESPWERVSPDESQIEPMSVIPGLIRADESRWGLMRADECHTHLDSRQVPVRDGWRVSYPLWSEPMRPNESEKSQQVSYPPRCKRMSPNEPRWEPVSVIPAPMRADESQWDPRRADESQWDPRRAEKS